jgi:hypothetical protein
MSGDGAPAFGLASAAAPTISPSKIKARQPYRYSK